tara:strand:- start:1882 stop:2517 length:636 start_codon:yes stop_codon:yes gene_type:complete
MSKERLDKLIEQKEKQNDTKDLPFLQSLRSNLEKWGNLTEKQTKALDKIEYLSSPEGKKEVEDWKRDYSAKYKKNAVVCAHYYLANPPYFNDVASNVVSNPDFVPTKPQYLAMCQNKYTKRVLFEYHKEPVYKKGDIVQVRNAKTMPYHLYQFRAKPCVVVENRTGKITTHAEGAKTYKVLPFGHTSMLECQERFLKGFRSPKGKKGEKDE